MNARNVLLWLHIVVAMLALAPLILFDFVVPVLVGRRDTGALRMVHELGSKLGPATLLVPILGLVLVAEGGYEMSDRWIIAALVLYVLMLANGMGILLKAEQRALASIEAGEDAQPERRTLARFGALNIVLFLAILWLMVSKPGM